VYFVARFDRHLLFILMVHKKAPNQNQSNEVASIQLWTDGWGVLPGFDFGFM
jgi:hypothetical protein